MYVKRVFSIAGILMLGFILSESLQAQLVKGNGNVIKINRKVKNIEKVSVEDGIDLVLDQGSEEAIVVEADENIVEHIRTEMKSGHLRIYTDKSILKSRQMRVHLTITDLKELSTKGGSDTETKTVLKLEKLEVSCSGGSDMDLELDLKELDLEASGGSDVLLKGTAKIVKMEASGGSDLDTYEMKAEKCLVNVSGGSDAKVFATKELNVNASGGSDVYYKGNPASVNSDVSGSSDIYKR
jgi:hypothetical protein